MKTIKLFLEIDGTQEEIKALSFEINGIWHPELEMPEKQEFGVLTLIVSENAVRPESRFSDQWLTELARKFNLYVSHIERY